MGIKSLAFQSFHHMKGVVGKTYCLRRYQHILVSSVQLTSRIVTSHTAVGATRHCHSHTQYQPSSALFVSGKSSEFAPFLTLDLDLEMRLNDMKTLKKNLESRGLQTAVDLEELANEYNKMVELDKKKQKSKEDWIISPKSYKNEYWDVLEQVMLTALKLPNYLHPDTPGKLEILEEIGLQAEVKKSESHVKIGQNHDLLKLSDIGLKAYYLKDELAVLEQSMLNYVRNKLQYKGFIQAHMPEFFRTLPVEGTGIDFTDTGQIYMLEQKAEGKHVDNIPMTGYYARGVSLVTFGAMVAKKIYTSSCLPLHYFVSGRSYLTEAAQEKLPGLFGALQTVKIDKMGLCTTDEEADSVFTEYWSDVVDMYRLFNCPMRLIRIPANLLHPSEQLRSEVQLWAPSIQSFVKVASVSLIGDYLSRRLMCRHSSDKRKTNSLVHMVHSEALDVTRVIALLMEYGCVDSNTGEYKLPELPFLEDDLRL